jgi:N-methylhydantoinase B
MRVDGYDRPIDLVAAVTIGNGRIHVDFDGTSNRSKFGINVPLAYTTAYTVFGLACALRAEVPNNAGSLAPLTVGAPTGSILNAPYPAAVSSRHLIGQMLPDVVFGCLRQVIPERVPAEGTSCLWNMTFRGATGANEDGDGFAITVTSNGGTGARPGSDGLSATAYPSGVRGTPVEIVEAATPLLFWRKELRPGSGGAGIYRGGHGQIIEVENRFGRPFELLAAFDRIDHPARGRDGGADGAAGVLSLKSGGRLKGKGFQDIPAGDRLIVMTPGGAGLGDPAARDPAAIEADRCAELVLSGA